MGKEFNKKVLIIGAGPCGLGAAWRLKELNYSNYLIVDKEPYPGGLATSFFDNNGFCWDLGGHVIHSHYKYFDKVISKSLKNNQTQLTRSAWVYLFNQYIPYPLQYNLHYLPKDVMQECIAGLISRKQGIAPQNYSQWLTLSFGEGLMKYFFNDYSMKVWTVAPKHLNIKWVGERVATVDIDKIRRNIEKKIQDDSWGPNYKFVYPNKGGNGSLWNSVAAKLKKRLLLKKTLIQINVKRKKAYFSDGTIISYDVILSTIPLTHLIRIVHDVKKIPKTALQYSKVDIVGVGIEGKLPDHLQDKLWIYFPQDNIPFFRGTLLSNFSKNMAPKGTWSILLEISTNSLSNNDSHAIIKDSLNALEAHKFLTKESVKSIWHKQLSHGYPIPTLQRDSDINTIMPLLEKNSIFSRGRFGYWKYEISNQDHTFMQGVEWVNKVYFGEKEGTINV